MAATRTRISITFMRAINSPTAASHLSPPSASRIPAGHRQRRLLEQAAGCAPYGPARTLPADSQRNSVYTFTFIAITVYAITHRKFTLQDNHRSPFTHNDNNNVTLLPLLQNSPFEPVTIQIQRRNRSAIQHCKLLVTTCTSYLH